jgi:hypothetical protein
MVLIWKLAHSLSIKIKHLKRVFKWRLIVYEAKWNSKVDWISHEKINWDVLGEGLNNLWGRSKAAISVLLRWSSSIRGVSKYHIQTLSEGSNASHQHVKIDNMEWLMDPSVHPYAIWKDPKSLAQVWTCSSQRLCWKPSSGHRSSMARLKIFKLKRSTKCFYSFLSIGMSYYQEGCNVASWPSQSAH